MKRIIQLVASFICLVFGTASLQAGLSYWDSNSTTPGAGDTPNGIWDSDPFWSADPAGGAATTTWTDGNTAVFSAGTDATNPFTVTVSNLVNPAGITFEEGQATISGGTIYITNVSDFPIIADTDATILSYLSGIGFKKTGPGTLTLGADNSTGGLGGMNTIAEGTVAITDGSALGYALSPTIVSNGASVEVSLPVGFANYVNLNGFGVSNRGALYCLAGYSGKVNPRTGGAVINSDARINHYGTNATWWDWEVTPITTNGLNSADLYFGGDGNTIRLDMNTDYPGHPGFRQPCINIGDGVLHKDGSSELRLENSNVAREVRFDGGSIMARCGPGTNFCYRAVVPGFFWCTEGVFWSLGEYVPATIYVGPNAGEFRNSGGGPSQYWQHPIVLEAGANPAFRPQSFDGAHITCEGVISGLGGLSKYDDLGTLNLITNDTYYGTTTIRGGTLALGINGSISNSIAIDVQSTNALFDVSAVSGGFVLQSGQTLQGNGSVVGNVTAAGTVSPGESIGTLSFSNNLTLGNLLIEVDKSVSPSNDTIVVNGSLSHSGGGTLTVANLGPALAIGDNFKIFNKAVTSGGTITVTGGGATWINNLAADGSITVQTVAPPPVPATNLTLQVAGPTSYTLGGMGAASSLYDVYASTNVALPMSNWWKIGSTNSDAGGVIQFLDSQATNAQRFYRFGQTAP